MFQGTITAACPNPDDPVTFRAHINLETGGDYACFRRTLTPRYRYVWRDICLGYLCLVLTVAAIRLSDGLIAQMAAILFGSICIGFEIAYLQLFIHEAAHFNLCKTRAANDRVANWLVCWQVGTDVRAYRRTHFDHHRFLGGNHDSENSYRNPLTWRFALKLLTGTHALAVFDSRATASETEKRGRSGGWPLLRGLGMHGAIVGTLIFTGSWASALAWVIGMGAFFPAFATLRQIIEHRPIDGAGNRHAVTRLFGDDIVSKVFGGAGFNRHLLHHLEPQISYTRLADLEAYLDQTGAAPALASRRASYFDVLRKLLREARG